MINKLVIFNTMFYACPMPKNVLYVGEIFLLSFKLVPAIPMQEIDRSKKNKKLQKFNLMLM